MATKTKPEKFLFPLTIEGFDSLFRGALQDVVHSLVIEGKLEHLKGINIDQSDTRDLSEAAIITGFKTKSIVSKVSRLELAALKRSRALMFSRAELEKWMRKGGPLGGEIMAREWLEKREKPR